jgi:tRNA (guanine37-N1)-methyltransferase
MKMTVLTLFPEILRGFFESSIMKRAVDRGLVSYALVNIRDYATDRHHKCAMKCTAGRGHVDAAGPPG